MPVLTYARAAILKRVVNPVTYDVSCDMDIRSCASRVHLQGLASVQGDDDAGRWVLWWFATHAPTSPAALLITPTRTRRAGRYTVSDGYVHAPDGACLNTDIIRAGHAARM